MGKIIMGVDPGYARVGIGIIEKLANRDKHLFYTCIETDKSMLFIKRLEFIYKELDKLIKTYKIDIAVIEKLYFYNNAKTVMDVGQARGVILLTLLQNNVEIYELSPLELKKIISSYGGADKRQIQETVKLLLNLDHIPQPDDTADALALALAWNKSFKYLN